MKTGFSVGIFIDQCRTTLDEPDGLARSCVLHRNSQPTQVGRKQRRWNNLFGWYCW